MRDAASVGKVEFSPRRAPIRLTAEMVKPGTNAGFVGHGGANYFYPLPPIKAGDLIIAPPSFLRPRGPEQLWLVGHEQTRFRNDGMTEAWYVGDVG